MGALVFMRQSYFFFSLVMLASLSGCAHQVPTTDLGQEHWQMFVDKDPKQWTRGADNWFFTGQPNSTELANRNAPYTAAMSDMQVRVPDTINSIRVNGDFQVQIFGASEHASAYLTGPNAGIQAVAVEVRGQTLYIHQTQPVAPGVMRNVIVRIGVLKLNNLTQMGNGRIEAIGIRSDDLCVASTADSCGNIYLAGRVNLRRVTQNGHGAITILGATASTLDISTGGSGPVNISGQLGIRSITHHGSSNINLIGATSYRPVAISADGSGKIGIYGCANLKTIQAKDAIRVYAYPINSMDLTVTEQNVAGVGLAGLVQNLYVDTYNSSRFDGSNLCARSAYVRAHDSSHINVTANGKIFASADRDGSIYFYGPANLLTDFPGSDDHVIAMGNRNWCNYNSEYRPYSYTLSHGKENLFYVYKAKRAVRGYKDE